MPYDYPDSINYNSSNKSFDGRKCKCCFCFGSALFIIEIMFAIISSFILVKEFLMNTRHSEILGSDLILAYIIRDEDINISFLNEQNITIINETSDAETGRLLSVKEQTFEFVNTTVRDFVNDIVNDIKNSSLLIDPDKKYFVSSMEFTYLTLAFE